MKGKFKKITPINKQVLVKDIQIEMDRVDTGGLVGTHTVAKKDGSHEDVELENYFIVGQVVDAGYNAVIDVPDPETDTMIAMKPTTGGHVIFHPNTGKKCQLIGLGLWLIDVEDILATAEVDD